MIRTGVRVRWPQWLLALVVLLSATGLAMAQTVSGQDTATRLAELRPLCDAETLNPVVAQVVCNGTLRVGVRTDYPGFSELTDDGFQGFEVDVAREIVARLGVEIELVPAAPVTRISLLQANDVDLIIATMGHTTQRDRSVAFLRPHYYRSETILVGAAASGPLTRETLRSRLVCTTVGNYSNLVIAPEVGRLMLFERSGQLIDALEGEICPLIAQDDSLLLPLFQQDDGETAFESKMAFAPVPWGMAMPPNAPRELLDLMSSVLMEMHVDGTFVALAGGHGLNVAFLASEQARYASAPCQADPQSCFTPPLDNQLATGAAAEFGERVEAFMLSAFGVEVRIGFLETEVGWRLFLGGLGASTLAVLLAAVSTPAIGLLFGAVLVSSIWPLRMMVRAIILVLQNVPVMLILVFMGAVTVWTFDYSFASAMLAAILAISGASGSFIGAAIADAYHVAEATPSMSRFRRAIELSMSQIDSYLINAVRGIAAASVVGVPDLVNALNDIVAFSGSQWFSYWVLVAFYVLAVMLTGQAVRVILPKLVRRTAA